jgi:hypothetical protein
LRNVGANLVMVVVLIGNSGWSGLGCFFVANHSRNCRTTFGCSTPSLSTGETTGDDFFIGPGGAKTHVRGSGSTSGSGAGASAGVAASNLPPFSSVIFIERYQ